MVLYSLLSVLWVFIARHVWKGKISTTESVFHCIVSIVLIGIFYTIAFFMSNASTQVLHGQVVEKVRDEYTRTETYSCRCDSDNNCSTCTRTYYGVRWYFDTTVGRVNIQRKETQSRRVWRTPDPSAYTFTNKYDHCAVEDLYLDYTKSQHSVFNKRLLGSEAANVVHYPTVYNHCRINNVINLGVPDIDANALNKELLDRMKEVGAQKQLNLILVLTRSQDRGFKNHLEAQWNGGRKNDFVVIIGVLNSKISWVDGFTFQDTINNHKAVLAVQRTLEKQDLTNVVNTVVDVAVKHYTRTPMKDFKYMLSELRLSTGWAILFGIITLTVHAILTTVILNRRKRVFR